LIGATVNIGSESVNTLAMMLTPSICWQSWRSSAPATPPPDTGTPTNASTFTQTAGRAGQTPSKYQGIIA